MKKVLLFYISEHSGHHCASVAIDNALRELDPDVNTLSMNSFNYTNPVLEKVINRAYMGVVRRRPEIWEYLYDNPKVVRKTQGLREMIHRFNTGKLKALLDEFRPNAIVCTQAFPCGMVADYKKSSGMDTPLIGVLTDYAPHSYWIYDNVDRYIVPSEGTGKRLIENGIDPSRVMPFGIPIDPRFRRVAGRTDTLERLSLDGDLPCVLIMGGTQGLGPITDIARMLSQSDMNLQIIIAAGNNSKLYKALKSRRFEKRTLVLPYADNVDELMQASSVIITKPGGMTTAEALAKGLPMLIVNPLPGQEAMNTRFLLQEGVALKAESPCDTLAMLRGLLNDENELRRMSEKAVSLSRPDSAIDTARMILEIAK